MKHNSNRRRILEAVLHLKTHYRTSETWYPHTVTTTEFLWRCAELAMAAPAPTKWQVTTVELGYNVMKGTEYTRVVINERCANRGLYVMLNIQELTGTTGYRTL
jgi:hypothetical protein